MNHVRSYGSHSFAKLARCSAGAIAFVLVVGCLAYGAADDRSGPIQVDLSDSLRARQPLTIQQLGDLAQGGKQVFRFDLPFPESIDLRIRFKEAPFNGTQLNVECNGHRLVPYYAFGGDTRYDGVKDDPGVRPPLATIEGRWLIPADWVLPDKTNSLVVWTTGVQSDDTLSRIGPALQIQIESLRLGPVDGRDLPVYSNSIYYDFSIWAQGQPFGLGARERQRYRYDLALAGVINGNGMLAAIPPLGKPPSALWAVKRACEDDALGWGIAHREFYTIWELAGNPQLWARYIDVDGDPETQTVFHSQTISAEAIANDAAARGADVVLHDVEKYANALEPAIRMLAPYTDYYNFSCEQHGPAGQGFGNDGQRWAHFNVTGDDWATDQYQAAKAARDLVQK